MPTTGTIQAQFQPGIFLVAKAGAATITVGTLVYVKSFNPANNVATVEQMLANSSPTLDKLWGVVVRNMGTGGATVPIGGICQVQVAGPCPVAYTISPAPAVDDPLYVSDTGTVDDVAGTTSKVIGRVGYVSGTTVYMIMDGAFGSGGGGGSATAPVLLTAPDGDFPSGVDISDIQAELAFTDTVGLLNPGVEGAPQTLVFDSGVAGLAGDAVGSLHKLRNAPGVGSPVLKEAGAAGFGWVDPTGASEISEWRAGVMYLGALALVATLRGDQLLLTHPTAGQIYDIKSDKLRLTSDTFTRLHSDTAIDAYVGSTAVWRAADEDFTQPSNMATQTWEARVPRRRAATTTNATPTVLDSFTPGGVSAGGILLIDVTTRVMGSNLAGTEYVWAERRSRFAYVQTLGITTQISGPYVPIPDDSGGAGTHPSVTLDEGGGAIRVLVTGVASTTIKWTSHTSIELHEVA